MQYSYRGEQRQHISISAHVDEVIHEDMRAFMENENVSGFINRVVLASMKVSEASISVAKENYRRKLISEIKMMNGNDGDDENAEISKEESRIISYLVDRHGIELQKKYDSRNYTKDVSHKIRLQNELYDKLYPAMEEGDYYDAPGRYITALLEDYCGKSYYEREKIYYGRVYERLQKELRIPEKERDLLKITYFNMKGEKNVFRVKPYRLTGEAEAPYNYLIVASKRHRNENEGFKPAVFRLSRIIDIDTVTSFESGKLTHREKQMIEDAIKKRGVQFLQSEEQKFVVRLSPEGVKLYDSIYRMRPSYDTSETYTDENGCKTMCFYCSPLQIRSYFFQFGKEAFILSPKDMADSFYKDYRSAYEAYKKQDKKD